MSRKALEEIDSEYEWGWGHRIAIAIPVPRRAADLAAICA